MVLGRWYRTWRSTSLLACLFKTKKSSTQNEADKSTEGILQTFHLIVSKPPVPLHKREFDGNIQTPWPQKTTQLSAWTQLWDIHWQFGREMKHWHMSPKLAMRSRNYPLFGYYVRVQINSSEGRSKSSRYLSTSALYHPLHGKRAASFLLQQLSAARSMLDPSVS